MPFPNAQTCRTMPYYILKIPTLGKKDTKIVKGQSLGTYSKAFLYSKIKAHFRRQMSISWPTIWSNGSLTCGAVRLRHLPASLLIMWLEGDKERTYCLFGSATFLWNMGNSALSA